jgi:mannosyltransferase
MGRRTENALTIALVVCAIAAGAFLRFDGLGEPSYWLDEILHQLQTDKAAARPWWQWFGQLHDEHAGLYYLTQVATRLFGTSEFAGRSAAALFGLATIPLLWLVPVDKRARAAAIVLLTVSPLHVYYSREARGYALLMLLTCALIAILLRGRSVGAFVAVVIALAYTSAVASTVVASAAAVCFLIALVDREHRRWYAIAGTCATVALALFRLVYAARPTDDPSWPGFPPLDWPFFTSLARMFSVSALGDEIAGRAAVSMFVLAIIGAVAITRRDRRAGIVLTGMTVLPFAITMVALRVFDHFFAVRYVVASLIGYVLLAGVGMWTLASLAPRFPAALTLALAFLTAAQGWHSARTEPFRKLDWRGIAASLRQHLKPGDVILAAEPWSEVSLRYYLGEVPGVRLVYMAGTGIAEILLIDSPSAWLVTAGNSGATTEVRKWMCRYPVVLTSTLENFRLHYEPSLRDFVQNRTGPAELRAISAGLGDEGFTILPRHDLWFGSGWADAEGTFRWAADKQATLVFPRRAKRDRTISFHAYPAAAQTMRVSLNGREVGSIALAPEWRDYSIPAPAALWNEGMNTLAFDFEKTIVPSAQDPRELAAMFDRISIDKPHEPDLDIRIADRFIDERTAWRNTITRIPSSRFPREQVDALLGRVGFDPALARRELDLEDVASTVAGGSDCEDDLAFLHRAFAVLLERAPNSIEEQDLLRRMHEGATRDHIARRIIRAMERRRPAG